MINFGFTAWGTPAPQGSKRHVGGGRMIESSKAVRPWRDAVKTAALAEMFLRLERDTGAPVFGRGVPVTLSVRFYMKRPVSHYGTGRNAGVLKPSAPFAPTWVPDLSKLVRSTEDAITDAGVWHDDSQVVTTYARKLYARSAPYAEIEITEVAP